MVKVKPSVRITGVHSGGGDANDPPAKRKHVEVIGSFSFTHLVFSREGKA